MIWLYRLQQRLSITRQEAIAILTLTGLFLLGTTVRHVRQQMTPPLQVAPLVARSDSTRADSTHADSIRADTARADTMWADAIPSGAPSHEATVLDAVSADSAQTRPAASATSGASASGRINVNRASVARLQALPGIGPALAGRIEAFRAQRPFRTVDDLERVRGIGPKTLDRLRPLVTVDE